MSEAALTPVLGGTFDPVHLGHLTIAERVRQALGARRVLLLLSALPPHKDNSGVGSTRDRLAMLRLAASERPGLEICTMEIERGGVSYTIDSLRALRAEDATRQPVFIVGSDSLLELPTWRDWPDLIAEFDLIAFDRPELELESIRERLDPAVRNRLEPLPLECSSIGTGGRIFHFPMSPVAISSSRIRALAATGADLSGLVSPAVGRYIQRKGLYRREENR